MISWWNLRCEGRPRLPAPGTVHVWSDPSARHSGDIRLDLIQPAEEPRCLTHVPGNPEGALDVLAKLSDDWKGMIRVVPGDWGWSALDRWTLGSVAAALADARRPLLIDIEDARDVGWGRIYELATGFPGLPLILGASAGQSAPLTADLARACPNLIVDLGHDLWRRLPDELLGRLGPTRFIFGSDTRSDAGWTLPPSLLPTEILQDTAQTLVSGAWYI